MELIADRIYLGNSHDAINSSNGIDHITAILNVAIDLDIPLPKDPNKKYFKSGIIDGGGNTPEQMKASVKALFDLWTAGETILIHCHAGMSRSPTILAIFLSVMLNIPLEQAFVDIARRRPVITPNKELILLARQILKEEREKNEGRNY